MEFSIWTDVKKASVVEVTEPRCLHNGVPVEGGLRDPKFGCIGDGVCGYCGKNRHNCPGHWGHIEFPIPVIHIGMVPHLIQALRKDKQKYTWNKKNLCILKHGTVFPTTDMPETCHRFLIKVLPVPPIHIRPPLTIGNTTRGENDLTYRLLNIVRKNISLAKAIDKQMPPHVVYEAFEALQYAVACYINNDKVGSSRKSNRREYTSLAGRIKGKEGTMRGHCMGKRVDQSGRCVITGDNRLKLSEIGIPTSIARTLTKPVKVTDHNIAALRKAMDQGKIRYAVLPSGARIDTNVNKPRIRVGWTLEQSLQDGDLVLFNRQPSLHKMSIMCHTVRVLPHNTLRFNAACTTPYNADFDGDEMNIHVPQTIEAQAEAAEIMSVKYQVVSPQASRPVIGVIQDTMLGAYLLSGDTLDKADAFQITQRPIEPPYTGLRILSLIVPHVWYSGGVEIEAGTILSGRFRKKDLGCSTGSLVHVLFNDCGPQVTIDFIWELEQFTSRYLHIRGFTVGINDLKRSRALENLCQEEITQAFQQTTNMDEPSINARLNESRNIIGSAAMAEISKDNQFYTMIYAGSKGSKVNITQIQGCIGQQNVLGHRIQKDWSDRTMTCYPHGCNSPESRGFIRHTYLQGLTPQEMYFCAMAGREGLIDTAIKTAQTGYVERRLMKCLENITTHRDGSARDGDTLIQFKYGDDGFDAMKIERTKWGDKVFDLPVPLHRLAKKYGVALLPGDPGPDLVQSWIAKAPPAMRAEALELLEQAKVAPGECVGAVAAQSIGERATQCTLNSVDYNEYLVIQGVGTCAGAFIDPLCDPDGPETQYVTLKGKKALTLDKYGNVSWKKLIAVTRHPPGPMIKVTTKSGRTMTCTTAKSFLTLKRGRWMPTSGTKLKTGMHVPLLAKIPSLHRQEENGKVVGTFMATGTVDDSEVTMDNKYLPLHMQAQAQAHEPNVYRTTDRATVLKFQHMGITPLVGCSEQFALDFLRTYMAHKAKRSGDILMVRADGALRDAISMVLCSVGIHSALTPKGVVVHAHAVDQLRDTWADEITHIEPHVSSHKYVYDLTVQDTKNMVLLNGIGIRDTFHFAGVSSKNVTLGLPRLEEILNLSKKIKTPLTTFKSHRHLAQTLKYIALDVEPVNMTDDLDEFWKFPDPGEYKGEPVRIVTELGYTETIVQALHALHTDVAYVEHNELLLHVYARNIPDGIPEHIGVPGAEWCKDTGELVETSLDVFTLIGLHPEVFKTVYTNDIHTIRALLGVEAARVAILIEIRKILAHYGIDLNVRHLLLLADWMTQNGNLTPMTRHGLKKIETGVLKRATFEEVVGVFINAAVQERKDPVDSISACILTGKIANIGSNTVHTEAHEAQETKETLFDDWTADFAPQGAPQHKPVWLTMSPDYAPED